MAETIVDGVEWVREPGLTGYDAAVRAMEERAAAIHSGTTAERVWLVEHPQLYTAGTSAAPDELLNPRFPVHRTGRGGRFTYHGPGQRVGYLMLDLSGRGRDVRCFVHGLEQWLIAALARLGVGGRAIDGRVGIWVDDPHGREAKVGAIGVRVKRWVTLHGFALNVAPELAHFGGIVPCGLPDFPVTSLAALGGSADMGALDAALLAEFPAFLARLGRGAPCS